MISESSLKRCKIVGSIGQCSLANNEISLPTCTPNVSIENLQEKCPNVILGDKGQHEIAQNFTNSCTANSIVALLPHFFNNEINKDFILSVLHSGRDLYCKVDDGKGNYTFADQYDGKTFFFEIKNTKLKLISNVMFT